MSLFRGWFLVFTLSVAINCSITIFMACYCIAVEGWKLLYVVGLIEALIFCGLGWLLSGFTVSCKYCIIFNIHGYLIGFVLTFSSCMLPWTLQPMRCSTTSVIIISRMQEVNITIRSLGELFTTWPNSSCAYSL